jgi:hypothetical protein
MNKKMIILITIVLAIFLAGLTTVVQASNLSAGNLLIPNANQWYVTPNGSDMNNCQSVDTPCATINAVINKPIFVDGDIIYVAEGIYTSAIGSEVVFLNKSADLSGGWSTAFDNQNSRSIIDGSASNRGITISPDVTATIDRFVIQNGLVVYNSGAGIKNEGNLTLTNSIIQNNQAGTIDNPANSSGAGIYNNGKLDLEMSSIINNYTHDHYTCDGGGIVNDGGSVVINRSSINKNYAGHYGGGILNTNGGTLVVNNSTISENHAGNLNLGGGINNGFPNTGITYLNNSTVSNNIGNGIITWSDSVTMQNTILTGNLDSDEITEQNCIGNITSVGYNILGSTRYCDFSSTVGDLLNVNPWILPLMGDPAFNPIWFISPAVNAGNPSGCTDNLGNPLPVDQRGVDRNGRCDIGAYEYDPALDPYKHSLIPIINKNCPPIYFDNFSDSTSGWPIVNTGDAIYEYNNGEYRISIQPNGYTIALARPGIQATNYRVSVDLRNELNAQSNYGIAFGINEDWSGFYALMISPDTQFSLVRFQDFRPMWSLAWGYSSALRPGTETNHIMVEREGESIRAYANGTLLADVSDSNLMGSLYMGLLNTTSSPNSDIRYDNFQVDWLHCTYKNSSERVPVDSYPSWFEFIK